MTPEARVEYDHVRSGQPAYRESKSALIAVWGKEAVQFLDGLISNDMKTLADGAQMLAAFPNAQGRLLAVVRVRRLGDRYLFQTEEATREKLFNNLFRFTYAGDFFVEDLSDNYDHFELLNLPAGASAENIVFNKERYFTSIFVPKETVERYRSHIASTGSIQLRDESCEILRVEAGIPRYDLDMDETTIVPELGLESMISYNKGCYIGQEIIARIYFRGHVAKRLTGVVCEANPRITDLTTADGKGAGRLTSTCFSPEVEKFISLAYVRYDHLAAGTRLRLGDDDAIVTDLPFVP